MKHLFIFLLGLLVILPAPVSANEGAGLLFSDLNGALPKGLWRKQMRSEINFLLKNLPPDSDLKSVQEIKRNMLLSYYDTTLIVDDIKPPPGEDLLTLRLQKLLEMGLWQDAFSLYTKSTEDPGNNDKLAQIGVLLIMAQKGLSTACLEEKVLAPRFPDSDFWTQIDSACAVEIQSKDPSTLDFAGSTVLQAVYNDKDFKISANDVAALENLSFLELALLARKKRINYDNLASLQGTPPHILKTFLNDPNFPQASKESLEELARRKILLPESPPALSEENEDLAENSVESLSQQQLTSRIAKKLKSGQAVEADEISKMAALSGDNPENLFYIQILEETFPHQDLEQVTPDVQDPVSQAISVLEQAENQQVREKVNFLKSLLDKEAEFSNNPANVYEKQISLTPDGHYVMPTDGSIKWLRKTQQHQLVGLSLLLVLSNIDSNAYAKKADDNSENSTVNVLKSLSTVGLIDQAHKIAKEELANLMELYS
jgi:Rps23 Pro-64 3,4-dihydroxylase Tpa1-like proline 4-hydroxylase